MERTHYTLDNKLNLRVDYEQIVDRKNRHIGKVVVYVTKSTDVDRNINEDFYISELRYVIQTKEILKHMSVAGRFAIGIFESDPKFDDYLKKLRFLNIEKNIGKNKKK